VKVNHPYAIPIRYHDSSSGQERPHQLVLQIWQTTSQGPTALRVMEVTTTIILAEKCLTFHKLLPALKYVIIPECYHCSLLIVLIGHEI